MKPTRSPLLNKLQAKTDLRVSPRPPSGAKWEDRQTDDDDGYGDDYSYGNDDGGD